MAIQPASAQDLGTSVERIGALFEQGFNSDTNQARAARDAFLEAANIAENVLATHADLDPASTRDMHQQAGNAYYYAAQKEYWLANESDDDGPLKRSEISHLEQALAHHTIVFAQGQDGLLVAEYLFGTSRLVELGMESGDPRTAQWSAANVHAGRLRIDESKMFGNQTHYSAMSELALALLNFGKLNGDVDAKAEAASLIEAIPDDERSYELRSKLK